MSSLTPMMRQYLDIHDTVPDTILFYRLGDFYEMFFDDAKKVSKELDLVLTGRNCGLEEKAPMCGVPYHSADGYIAKLVEKGYKVAICEQAEDPAQAKGLVKREIVRIISPGTVTDNNVLKDRENNYLMSIYYNKTEFGVAYTDLSTGEFSVTKFTGANRISDLLSFVSRTEPSQIIVNTVLYEDLYVNKKIKATSGLDTEPYPVGYYSYEKGKERIKLQFNVFSMSATGLEESESIVRACGALIKYLEETQKKALVHINKITIIASSDVMHLDLNTKRNLELIKNLHTKEKKGSLLWVLDKTATSMGGRELKKWVLEPLTDQEKIEDRSGAVSALLSDIMVLDDILDRLSGIKDIERILSRLTLDIGNGRDLLALRDSVSVLPKIKVLISKVSDESRLLSGLIDEINELGEIYELIYRGIDEECPAVLKNGGLIRKGFNEKIDDLKFKKDNTTLIKDRLLEKEIEKTGIKNLKIKYNKVFGYFFEVTNSYKDLVPDYFIRKQTLVNAERYFTEELKEMEIDLLSADDQLKAIEYREFVKIKNFVLDNIRDIQSTANALARLDCLCSLAIVAKRNNYVKPSINNSGEIIIKEGRHPVVEQITGLNSFIHNDTLLDNDENRMLIITGANMAGKSTYIRQVALITVMAQIGSYVPASEADISICDRVFTRVGASDDLASGQSTFMVEMSEVSNILKFATKNSLVILDEVGRGTSTFDGLSIAHAVIEYLLDKDNIGAKTLFATHYHELTKLEEGGKEGIKNYSIRLESDGDEIVFLRKIERGGIDKSYGIEVAKLAGLPGEVIDKSTQILEILEETEEEYKEKSLKIEKSLNRIDRQPGKTETQKEINPKLKEILLSIKDMPIEQMSPIEVMNYISEIKENLSKEDL